MPRFETTTACFADGNTNIRGENVTSDEDSTSSGSSGYDTDSAVDAPAGDAAINLPAINLPRNDDDADGPNTDNAAIAHEAPDVGRSCDLDPSRYVVSDDGVVWQVVHQDVGNSPVEPKDDTNSPVHSRDMLLAPVDSAEDAVDSTVDFQNVGDHPADASETPVDDGDIGQLPVDLEDPSKSPADFQSVGGLSEDTSDTPVDVQMTGDPSVISDPAHEPVDSHADDDRSAAASLLAQQHPIQAQAQGQVPALAALAGAAAPAAPVAAPPAAAPPFPAAAALLALGAMLPPLGQAPTNPPQGPTNCCTERTERIILVVFAFILVLLLSLAVYLILKYTGRL